MVAPRALDAKQEKDVAKRYKKGESSQSLADEFGVHRSTIVTAVRRQGGELRPAGGTKTPAQRSKTVAARAK